jgi:predicted dienelactone hydrolase
MVGVVLQRKRAMRRLLSAGLLAVVISVGSAQAAEPHPPVYRVGMMTRAFVPTGTYDWRSDANHVLATLIWYPARPDAPEHRQLFGPPGQSLLDGGRVAGGAALSPVPAKAPLIVLSHGTGGTGAALAWLGTALAAHGYIVAAVNHPGNNAVDGYTVPGFTLWWLRARDLSAVIDGMLADPTFGPRIDRNRIGAAGFSLGGYTVIAIAGGITSLVHFRDFCAEHQADRTCLPPPEFPEILTEVEALAKHDPAYRVARAEAGRSYRDPRVRAVFAMAPALGPAFLPSSLAHIDIPFAIVAGAADEIMPVQSNAQSLAAAIPHAELTILPGSVGHYVFTDNCTAAARTTHAGLCVDAPGVDRTAIHRQTARLAETFFERSLH